MRLRAVRRVLAATTVGLVVLVAAVTAADLVGGDAPAAAPRPPDCVAQATAPADEMGAQAATWVRFCPLAQEGAAQRVRHPQGVVTGDLAASVAAGLWEVQDGRRLCEADGAPTPGPTRRFRIEVGLADGRVSELRGDTGCSSRDLVIFSQLETTLLMDAASSAAPAADPADPQPAALTCPRRLTTTSAHPSTNADGASAELLVDRAEHPWQSTVPLLPLPAATVDVCAYTGDGPRRRLVDQWRAGAPRAEPIRVQATIGYRDGQTDCGLDPRATSYVVVLADATGTARTLTLDPTRCSPLSAAIGTPPVDTYLGLASVRLVRMIARSRP